jgi:hypothetical protein
MEDPVYSTYCNTGGGEDWSWLDYGNVRFIGYPEPWADSWRTWTTKVDPIMSQAQNDPNIQYIIVFGHRPAWSSGYHHGESALATAVTSLHSKYSKFVLQLSGHSHNYERTDPSKTGGVINITSGGGGGGLENGSCSNGWNPVNSSCSPPDWSVARLMHYGYLKLSVGTSGITGQYICGPGGGETYVDSCTQGSIADTFTIGSPVTPPTDARPTVSLTKPADGTTVAAGTSVAIAGVAGDDKSLSKVDVKVDGSVITTFTGSAASSFSTSWTAASGTHTITATATDSANQTTTATLTITVSAAGGTPCTVPSTDYGIVSLTANVTASGSYRIWSRMAAASSTANSYFLEIDGSKCYTVGGSSVPVYSTSQPFTNDASNWIAKTTASQFVDVNLASGNHSVKIIGNSNGVLIDRLILTQDTSCMPTGNGDNCANPKDTVAPVVSITFPASGATIAATTTVQAQATDDTLVTKVEFYIDGLLRGSDATAATGNIYTYGLDPSTLSNGSHTLTAKAYDAALNSAASSPVTINIGSTPPATKTGDINSDGSVNFLDFSLLASKYGQSGAALGRSDINADGKVDFLDFSILAGQYGT